MRFNLRPWRYLAAAIVIAGLAFTPMTAAGQSAGHRGGGGGGSSSGGGGGGGGHQPSSGGERVGTATPRTDGGSRSGGSTGSSGGGSGRSATPTGSTVRSGSDARDSSDGSDGNTPHSRPRDGQPIEGRAEPRGGGHGGGGGTIIVPGGGYYGGYYPWAYGGFGFAGYYGGVYDPWFYGGDPFAYSGSDEGALRLKVKPRDATVMVDGYFAGQVDDFDGVFQRLKLEPGPHRIEVSAEGYDPLTFEIRVLPDRTLTYKGELKHTP